VALLVAFPDDAPADAPLGYNKVTQARGFDRCSTPSVAQMQTWWTYSPYYNHGFYIGGPARSACGFSNQNASWVSQVNSMGWGLFPVWVGPQAPAGCTGRSFASRISTNLTTAYNQGRDAATNARNTGSALGFTAGTILYDDIEAYTRSAACSGPVKQFVQGWTTRLAELNAKSGVYGDACNAPDWAAIGRPPLDVWVARWNVNDPSVHSVDPCLSDNLWNNHQRHHQFQGGHSVTFHGVTMTVDDDCSDGLADGSHQATHVDSYCIAP
jgi:hypothetical protein